MNPNYITPRIAIAKITSLNDLQAITKQIQLRHKQYSHFFNLTNAKMPIQKESNFKWRGIPFSSSEVFKILAQIDVFLRINIANTAIICVANANIEEYAKIIVKSYIDLCLQSSTESTSKEGKRGALMKLSDSIIKTHPYFLKQIQTIYKNISIHSPPIKILQSFSLHPQNLFIPIIQIFNEGRYNDFQSVYYHAIEQQLAIYYLNLNRPLQTGIGKKYYDSRPETKYFSKPIIVFGDVKIVVYSYKTLKKVYQFTLGFNTHNIDTLNTTHTGVFKLENSDLYDRNGEANNDNMQIQIEYSDYCDNKQCRQKSSCNDCRQLQKKLSNRYGQVQLDLQKLHRSRNLPQISSLLSI